MVKKVWFKILTGAFIFLVIAIIAVVLYLKYALPSIPLEEVKVQSTPEMVARGEYLANHVTVCIDCHSTRDWSRFSGPITPGTLGKGGEIFDQKLGFPGSFASPNITPFHLNTWSDAEIFRAITTGVSKDGRALFPIMPYDYYGKLDKSDILAIIAYIRTLQPVESNPPASNPAFPMSLILNTLPQKANFSAMPTRTDTIAYGDYLIRAAGCVVCHTPAEHGQIVEKLSFSGGREFQMPDGTELVSPNITPDMETGIGKWSREAFIFRFKSFDLSHYTPPVLSKGEMQSIMPWTMYAGMDTTDLTAIYRYLHNLKPISNPIAKTRPVL